MGNREFWEVWGIPILIGIASTLAALYLAKTLRI